MVTNVLKDGIMKSMDNYDKAKYVEAYDAQNPGVLKKKGIIINNLQYNAGVAVLEKSNINANEHIQSASFPAEFDETLDGYRGIFAQKVYNMDANIASNEDFMR